MREWAGSVQFCDMNTSAWLLGWKQDEFWWSGWHCLAFACCIFHIISIPFNCSDTALRVTKAMIGAKVSPCLLCFLNLAPELLISETRLKFLIWTQGEICPSNWAHVKRPWMSRLLNLLALYFYLACQTWMGFHLLVLLYLYLPIVCLFYDPWCEAGETATIQFLEPLWQPNNKQTMPKDLDVYFSVQSFACYFIFKKLIELYATLA